MGAIHHGYLGSVGGDELILMDGGIIINVEMSRRLWTQRAGAKANEDGEMLSSVWLGSGV